VSRTRLSRCFVALVIATLFVSVGVARSAAPAHAEDKPDAVRAIIVAASCGLSPNDVTGKGSKPGVRIDMTARLLNPVVSECDPTPDAAATDRVKVAKTAQNEPLGCAGQPAIGFCDTASRRPDRPASRPCSRLRDWALTTRRPTPSDS
jgi:hypothetical protein